MKLDINGEPAIIIPMSGWIELSEVLREFVSRADAGERARRAYGRCMNAVADANPELRQGDVPKCAEMNSAIRCEQRDDGSIEIFVNDVVRGRYAGWKELAMHLGFCIAARDAIAIAKEAEQKWYHGLDPDIT